MDGRRGPGGPNDHQEPPLSLQTSGSLFLYDLDFWEYVRRLDRVGLRTRGGTDHTVRARDSVDGGGGAVHIYNSRRLPFV